MILQTPPLGGAKMNTQEKKLYHVQRWVKEASDALFTKSWEYDEEAEILYIVSETDEGKEVNEKYSLDETGYYDLNDDELGFEE